ncbi:daptide-type RiPP biosynthesis dehydogenase [Streptomyces rochei]|uniref:daptide-type RiPP biosynthesis dehydogenase n=1 Tax=Streptomyces TaxID=1883 RepID=UPI002948D48E|nr:daptide-type RiPP biosynthesis dehydogenase [Streptomyces sp. UP1A-1]
MRTTGDNKRQPLSGTDELAQLLRSGAAFRGRNVTVLVDDAVVDSVIHQRVAGALGKSCAASHVFHGSGDLRSVLALAERLAGAELVVGLGGGSLLDQAKLATLVAAGPDVSARLTVPQRSGLIVLAPEPLRPVPLIAVPTTVGTGSESSAVACLTYPQGKRLVMGKALRPEIAVIDSEATVTLPQELVAEGVLEVLFRLVSPYVGDHGDLPPQDARVEDVARRLVRLGYEVRDAARCGQRCSDGLRLEIAELSGSSHDEWFHSGRDPYAVKGWLVANELSSALEIRKMTAVAALLPPLWRAIDAGERRLGSARRLRRLWSLLRSEGPGRLPADPASGMAALIDSWGIDRSVSLTPDKAEAVALRIVRAWGAGLPMLGGLAADDLLSLLREAAGREPQVRELPPAA